MLELRRRRRSSHLGAALVVALLVHLGIGAFLWWLAPAALLPPPVNPTPAPIEVTLVDLPKPSATVTPHDEPGTQAQRPAHRQKEATSATSSTEAAEPRLPPAERGTERSVSDAARAYYETERQRILSERSSDSHPREDPRLRRPTDSIDGVPNLGTGAPGDPRIPGSGGVDIGEVAARDAEVGIARLRAREGLIHPFIARVKREMEKGWRPEPADVTALRVEPQSIADPVCAKGHHERYRVARVFAVYDARGAPLRLRVDGAPVARNLRERIRNAAGRADLRRKIPPELLDDDQTLRLAWNVYLDDYTGCGLFGRGSDGTVARPGEPYVVGVIELDGVY